MRILLAVVLPFFSAALAVGQEIKAPLSNTSQTEPASMTLPFSAEAATESQAAWAKALGCQPVETNSIGVDMVLVPPGAFKMGSPRTEKQRDNDENQVGVTLTRPYRVGRTEVTQSQWRAVMHTTPWEGSESVRSGDDYPAVFVSWEDAQEFCRRLSAREGQTYRLPTEAEWEFACRAGTETRFSFGDDEKKLGDYCWYGGLEFEGNARNEQYPHQVATRKPNQFGLYDVHGNVWEWCQDVYDNRLPGGTDPVRLGESSVKVFRGNGWTRHVGICRSASREWFTPSPRIFDIGFRVAQTVR